VRRIGRLARARCFVLVVLAAALLVLAGCRGGSAPDTERIPDGEPRPLQGMAIATGPVVVLGRGQSFGLGWRYAAYPSADGTCFIVETGSGIGGGSCGSVIWEDAIFGGVSVGTGTDQPQVIEGLVSPDVAALWITTVGGQDVEARLMSLAPMGLEGQAFLAIVPAGMELRAAVALDAEGGELATNDL